MASEMTGANGCVILLSSAPGRWVVAITVLGSGIAALDATVVNIALPTIGRDFHTGIAALQWVMTSYILTLAAKTVVGVSPIIGGAPVRGMADACLTAIGVPTSAAAVAAHYGPELIDGWLVDDQDKAVVDDPALAPIQVRALPLYMRDLPATTAIARAAIDLALELA